MYSTECSRINSKFEKYEINFLLHKLLVNIAWPDRRAIVGNFLFSSLIATR